MPPQVERNRRAYDPVLSAVQEQIADIRRAVYGDPTNLTEGALKRLDSVEKLVKALQDERQKDVERRELRDREEKAWKKGVIAGLGLTGLLGFANLIPQLPALLTFLEVIGKH